MSAEFCRAPRGTLRIGNQTAQQPTCRGREGHDGHHWATVLDSDDKAITVRWPRSAEDES